MIKTTGCFSRGLVSDSQYLHGGSQPFATPVPEDVMPSAGLYGHWTHGAIHTSRQNFQTHTIAIKKFRKEKVYITSLGKMCEFFSRIDSEEWVCSESMYLQNVSKCPFEILHGFGEEGKKEKSNSNKIDRSSS